ncbi:MAG: alpha-amylase family glycosyl hydrolase, partial [Chloroflexota bacterium]
MAGEIRLTRQPSDGPDRLVIATATPLATYRIQLHRGFTFTDAASLVPYLASLGISTLYLSPVFHARPASMHGYDVIDPTQLNPELGTTAEWSALLRRCSEFGMTALLDIVPNHMAVSSLNRRWWDVLENGRASPYADYFDIDWATEGRIKGRVLLPVLTEPLSQVIEHRELQLTIEETGISIDYKGMKLPLDVASYAIVLRRAARSACDGAVKTILKGLAATAESLADSHDCKQHHVVRDAILRGLIDGALLSNDSISTLFETTAAARGTPAMHSLLARQHYVLDRWWTARQHLNYRRFFDINDLIGIRVEDWPVFQDTHALLQKLTRDPAVCGFRVDHIDGLREPLQYLHRLVGVSELSDRAKPYIVVEKILTGDERLRDEWPVDGTTGYEFLSMVNGLFIDTSGLQELESVCKSNAGRLSRRSAITLRSKRFVLRHLFRADMRRLAIQIERLPSVVIGKQPPERGSLEKAILEVTARMPVYRTYVHPAEGIRPTDRQVIDGAVSAAQESASTSKQQRALDTLH